MRSTATHRFLPTRQVTGAYACRCGSPRTSTRAIRTASRFTCTSIALAGLLAGCGNGAGKVIPYRDISSQLHGFQPPRLVRQAFKTKTAFAKYVHRESPGIGPLPKIDWAHREAILVSAGPRSSTGYILRIVSVRETAHHVVVTVHEDTPTLAENVQARVTFPFRLITIPRTSKPLFLHWPGRP
jgi:PrcB C-terminal